MFILREQLD